MEKFIEKSAEELAGMNTEQLAGYFTAKQKNTEAQIKSLIEKSAKESNESIEAKIAELQKKYQADQVEQLTSINNALREQGLAIKAFRKEDKGSAPKPVSYQLREALQKNQDALKTMKTGGSADVKNAGFAFNLDTKAVGTMTFGNVSGGNIPVEDRMAGFNTIPSRRIRLLDIMTPMSTTSNVISWVYQANKEGAAGQTAEGATKNQIDFDLVVASTSVKKSTAFIKVSDEMLDDIPFLEGSIRTELFQELLKVVELQAYSGDGTGNNLTGVLTTATAFAAGAFATSVVAPNFVDVLTCAMDQIEIAEQGPANYILMHPSDITRLKLVKRTDEDYLDRLINTAGNLSLDGVPIIGTTLVTVDKYLIGNFDFSYLIQRDGLRIDIGLDADDFTKNLRTIRAEWRGAVIVKNNDRTAFVTGDFSTDITALTAA